MVSRRTLRALGCSALIRLATASTTAANDHDLGDFDWSTITPSWNLEYTPCYDGDFKCARLLLPLDWLESDVAKQKSESVAVAIIKLPAAVPSHDDKHGGAVIVNPGGPGDSGVLHILRNGHYMRGMMDTEGVRYFDMVSFDPRGMANSLPVADCFESDVVRAMGDWQLLGRPSSLDGKPSNASLAVELAQAAAMGLKCGARKDADGVVIQEFMSTASVARDMLRMVDEMDRLKKEDAEAVKSADGVQKKLGGTAQHGDPDVPRIQYYGTSYGTVLGNVFISMFPGRVKRMMLDGVVVVEDYIAMDWCPFLSDTTNAIDYFYKTCFSAGSEKCPLTRDKDESWQQVKTRVEDIIAHLDANPVPVAVRGVAPTVLTGTSVRGRMMDPIYNPLGLYDGLAETLAAAAIGNYTALIAESGFKPTDGDGAFCGTKPGDAAAYKWMALAGTAVRCGDAQDVRGRDLGFWRKYKERCVAASPEIGAAWADLSCAGWPIRPRYRFEGPFGSPEPDTAGVDGKPSAPVLFLSSRHDPVTPLASAHKAAEAHPGARVLVQESVGHCTLLSAPSECTRRITRAYMLDGVLPDEGASCPGDCVPFEECDQPTAKLPR